MLQGRRTRQASQRNGYSLFKKLNDVTLPCSPRPAGLKEEFNFCVVAFQFNPLDFQNHALTLISSFGQSLFCIYERCLSQNRPKGDQINIIRRLYETDQLQLAKAMEAHLKLNELHAEI